METEKMEKLLERINKLEEELENIKIMLNLPKLADKKNNEIIEVSQKNGIEEKLFIVP